MQIRVITYLIHLKSAFRRSSLYIVCLIISVLAIPEVRAQKSFLDSTYIESFADKFNVKINLETKGESFGIESELVGGTTELRTNNEYYIGASLDFQILGLSVAFSPAFLPGNDDRDLKGESSFFEINPRIAYKKWLQTFQYRLVEGYYIVNTEDFIPDWSEGVDPYIQLPNSQYSTFGMSTSFILNPNFSYKHVLFQTEWQKKSAGSFIPSFTYNYTDVSLTIEDLAYKDRANDLSIALSYYHTFVINEKWFIAPNITPSVGVSFSKLNASSTNQNDSEKVTYGKTALESGIQLGYSSKKILFGVIFNSDFYWYNQPNRAFIENNRIYGKLYFGYRFTSPGFIERPYSKFAKKVGI